MKARFFAAPTGGWRRGYWFLQRAEPPVQPGTMQGRWQRSGPASGMVASFRLRSTRPPRSGWWGGGDRMRRNPGNCIDDRVIAAAIPPIEEGVRLTAAVNQPVAGLHRRTGEGLHRRRSWSFTMASPGLVFCYGVNIVTYLQGAGSSVSTAAEQLEDGGKHYGAGTQLQTADAIHQAAAVHWGCSWNRIRPVVHRPVRKCPDLPSLRRAVHGPAVT
jgi:hypothetical protein